MSDNYKAVITKIKVREHPNADRIQIGTCLHEDVIVGKNVKDGDLGIFFPLDSQLSLEFAQKNDLIRRKDENGNAAGGFFEENRRVRAVKLRGVKSNGFWCPIKLLADHVGESNTSKLKEGDELFDFAGMKLCKKYISRRNPTRTEKKTSKKIKEICFPEHFDTAQLKRNMSSINYGDELIITEKVEGTSQRAGFVLCQKELSRTEKFLKWCGFKIQETEVREINGTRRVIISTDKEGYHSPTLRLMASEKIMPFIDEHMIVYFEVVGYEPEGSNPKPIMPTQNMEKTKDKEIINLYGKKVTYSYLCSPGEFDIYVYRICYVLPNGKTIELTWDQTKEWCLTHNINHVPELCRLKYTDKIPQTKSEFDNQDELVNYLDSISDGPSTIDPSHPREGICVRINKPDWQVFKNKGWTYKVGADIVKLNENYFDIEEES